MAMGHHYTPDGLAADLIGELNQARNAAGGAIPDRLLNIILESYQWLWQSHEWKFRRVRTILEISAETADLPDDFEKLDSKWLESNEKKGTLHFTDDVETFESWVRTYDGVTRRPFAALVEQASLTDVTKIVRVAPVPSQAYTYTIVYQRIAPDLENDGEVYWPSIMFDVWHALSKARAQRAFRRDDAWKESWAFYKAQREHAILKNDESMKTSTAAIVDGYGDMGAFLSAPLDQSIGTNVGNLLPD